MAKIYGAANGEIIRFLQTDAEEITYGIPSSYASMLDFDGDANANTIKSLLSDWNNYKLVSGVLQYKGVAVTIAPASQLYTDRQQLATIRDGLKTYYGLNNPTNAQTVAAVKGIIRALGIIFDYYLARR